MPVQTFRERMEDKQSVYKTEGLGIKQMGRVSATGRWRDRYYPHILPEESWSLNLWDGISAEAVKYFAQEEIDWHRQRHNMLSSQVMCVNIFFPLREHPEVLKPWLSSQFEVESVSGIDFEYVGPRNYFNEEGARGPNRTSADVCVTWENKEKKRHMLLLEFKFTERCFVHCNQDSNPAPQRCYRSEEVIERPHSLCHVARTGRTYWELIVSRDGPFRWDALVTESYCPFRYDFFEMMRQQLLAQCVGKDSKSGIDRADFGVMYHAENDELLQMSHPFGGERNPLKAWPALLSNKNAFHAFTIQELLASIDAAKLPDELAGWRSYLAERYGV